MADGRVLEFSEVTKRFRGVDAVAGLTTRIEPGVVTGFLGPNGAGKTTSLRILLGLVAPTSGHARIGGSAYGDLKHPLQTVGAALEASSFHPGRSAAKHLAVYAQAAGLPPRRVDEVLGLVGLADVAGRKVGGFSLGMRQRLGLATALLGDPGVLVLDEPSNGLDPEGIKWMRTLLQAFAAEGRTVLVSSHLLAEIQQTTDRLLILARGRLVFEGNIEDLAEASEYATIVDAPDRDALAAAVTAAGYGFDVLRTGLTVHGAETAEIGAVAARAGIPLSALQRRGPSLEEVFLQLIDGTRVHAADVDVAGAADADADADAAIADGAADADADADADAAIADGADAGTDTATATDTDEPLRHEGGDPR
jgi:ABC-2 type transport system ATP-binding protein